MFVFDVLRYRYSFNSSMRDYFVFFYSSMTDRWFEAFGLSVQYLNLLSTWGGNLLRERVYWGFMCFVTLNTRVSSDWTSAQQL